MLARGSLEVIALPSLLCIYYLATGAVMRSQWAVLVGLILLLLSLFLIVFFRDPERDAGNGIVSPADGVVWGVRESGEMLTVSIFMNVHNVHVNRAPYPGKVSEIRYRPGSHVPAFEKDSDRNERNTVVLDTSLGKMEVTQIAGLVARRIVCYVEEGQELEKGERIGMIRLGSRVDITMPSEKVYLLVNIGDVVKAGSSSIAEELE